MSTSQDKDTTKKLSLALSFVCAGLVSSKIIIPIIKLRPLVMRNAFLAAISPRASASSIGQSIATASTSSTFASILITFFKLVFILV